MHHKLKNLQSEFKKNIKEYVKKNAGAQLSGNILDQQTDEIIKARIRSAYKCGKKEYIFVCDKVLLWESENHQHKLNCQVVELEN